MSQSETFIVDLWSGVVTRVADPTPDVVTAPLKCVIYRTGGTENFKWHRTLAMQAEEAWDVFVAMIRLGYVGHVEDYFASLAVGLPETFSPDFPLVQEWH